MKLIIKPLLFICALGILLASCTKEIEQLETTTESRSKSLSNTSSSSDETDDIFDFETYEEWKEAADFLGEQLPQGSTIESLQTNEFLLDNVVEGEEGIAEYLGAMEELYLEISELTDEELISQGIFSTEVLEFMSETEADLLNIASQDESDISGYLAARFNSTNLLSSFSQDETKVLLTFGYNLRLDLENYLVQYELVGNTELMRGCGIFKKITCAYWVSRMIGQFLIFREILNNYENQNAPRWIANVCATYFNAFTIQDCKNAIDNGLWKALWDFCCGD